jgi:hypothetical protein
VSKSFPLYPRKQTYFCASKREPFDATKSMRD